jgi:tetratricopeptide (TPR) repeat protein
MPLKCARKTLLTLGLLLAPALASSASAERLGLLPFEAESPLALALPAALARSLESQDGLVLPAVPELGAYAARLGQERLLADYALDVLVSGTLTGSAPNYRLSLVVSRANKPQTVAVTGSDFAKLVAAASAAIIKAAGYQISSKDQRELDALLAALPNPALIAQAVTASGQTYLSALASAPDNGWLLSVRALGLAQSGNSEALTLASRAATLAPNDASVLVTLGAVQLAGKQFEAAQKSFQAALTINPAKPEAHYLSGVALVRAAVAAGATTGAGVPDSVLQAAIKEFSLALAANPRFLEAAYDLADSQVNLGNPGEAARALSLVVLRMPEEVNVHDRILTIALDKDATAGADYLRTAAKRFDSLPEGFFALAVRLPRSGDALELLAQGDKKYPKSALLSYARGEIQERSANYDGAAAAYLEASRRDPNLRQASLDLAAVLAKLGRFDEAEATLGRLDPKPDSLTVARMYLAAGRLERSSILLQQAQRDKPQDSSVNYLLGLQASREGRFDEAAKFFDAAIKADPTAPALQNARAVLAEARRIGVPKLDGDAVIFFRIGQGALDVGKNDEAVTVFERARASSGNANNATLGPVLFYLGIAYAESGNEDKAQELLTLANDKMPNNPVVMANLGAAQLQVGRFDLALETLDKTTKLDANYGRGWLFLGLANAQLGLVDDAKSALTKAAKLDSNLASQANGLLARLPK